MTGMNNVQEKAPDWLIMDYMPRYQITSLAGDGGSGKQQYGVQLRRQSAVEERPF